MAKQNLYPEIQVQRIKNPLRFYAIPLLGGFVKIIMLIPVWIELCILSFVGFFFLIIGAFYILFTEKYWQTEYELLLGIMRLQTKATFFFTGLTNRYPGFSLDNSPEFSVAIPMPKTPSRAFAIPLLGFVVRLILLIPFFIFSSIIQYASGLAILVSWIPVLFGSTYPETTFEITRDSMRLRLAISSFLAGFSDSYPSFWISMNHKTLKWIFIILATILMFGNLISNIARRHQQKPMMQYHYSYPSALQNNATY